MQPQPTFVILAREKVKLGGHKCFAWFSDQAGSHNCLADHFNSNPSPEVEIRRRKRRPGVMIREVLGYICLAGAVISFVIMFLIPKIRRLRETSHCN